jgi:hypothetical protein
MIRQAAPGQRLLASVSPRSVEMAGGLDNVLDRFAALGDCLIAVEKGMLEQRRTAGRMDAQRACGDRRLASAADPRDHHRPTGHRAQSSRDGLMQASAAAASNPAATL